MPDITYTDYTTPTVNAAWLNMVNRAVNDAQNPALAPVVNVKTHFGAKGDGVTDDTAAILAAMTFASGGRRSIYFPKGSYKISATINVPYGVRVYGEGEFVTTILYSGAGDGFYVGGPGNTTIISYGVVEDLTVKCSNRGANVQGLNLDNAAYFAISRVSSFGSGSPNDTDPAARVLYGNGVNLSNNTIIGYLNKVTTRLWLRGRYYHTLPGSQSFWTAAIVDGGQGESANNMYGIVVGDPTTALTTATGVAFRDLTVQGNYTEGVRVYSGQSTTFDNVYAEGNANYDFAFGGGAGLPVMCRVLNSPLNSEDIGTTPYGTFPYLAKIRVFGGQQIIIDNNDIEISRNIPLIIVDAAASETSITKNRLQSASSTLTRIQNASISTYTAGNSPENPRNAIGSFVRNLATASGNVVVTGVGFVPTKITLRGIIANGGEFSIGSVSLGNSIVNGCIHRTNADVMQISTFGLEIQRPTGSGQRAQLISRGVDGFTLGFTLFGTPGAQDITVQWEAERQ